jgi:adenylosuccinate lyase
MEPEHTHQSILSSRYVRDSALNTLFSEQHRIESWRQLWIWLAEAERQAGLHDISVEMVGN